MPLSPLPRRFQALSNLAFLVALLGVALIVSIWLLTARRIDMEHAQALHAAAAAADAWADKFEERTRRVIQQVDQTSLLLKHAFEAAPPGSPARLVVPPLLETDFTLRACFMGPDGDILNCNHGTAPGNVRDREYFAHHAARPADDALRVGAPVFGKLSKRWGVPMSRGLQDARGAFAGVLNVMVDPEALTDPFPPEGLGPDALSGVVSQDGVYRARATRREVQSGQRVSYERQVHAPAAQRGSITPVRSEIDGVERFVRARELRGYPLAVVVGVPVAESMADFEAQKQALLQGATLASLVVAGLAALLAVQARRLRLSRLDAQRARAVYVAASEASGDAFLVLSARSDHTAGALEFRIDDLNSGAAALAVVPRGQLVGHPLGTACPAVADPAFLAQCGHVVASGEPYEDEVARTLPDRGPRWLHRRLVRVGDGVAMTVRDITRRKQAQVATERDRAFLSSLVEHLPIAVSVKSAKEEDFGRYLLWNRSAEALYGFTADQAVGRTAHELLPAEIAAKIHAQDRLVVFERRVLADTDGRVATPSGERSAYTIRIPVVGAGGEVEFVMSLAQDLTELRDAGERLRLAHQVLEQAGEAVVVTDAQDRIVMANSSFCGLTGWRPEEAIGQPAQACGMAPIAQVREQLESGRTASGSAWVGEAVQQRRDGGEIACWLSLSEMRDEAGSLTHHVRVWNDISVMKATQQALSELALYDPLTRLPNRRSFRDRLQQAMARADRYDGSVVVAFIDLDNFKHVNDSLGHEIGDALLERIAERLQGVTRETDSVCRLGGDEFTIVCENLLHADDIAALCRRVLDAIAAPFEVRSHRLHVTASVGVSVYPQDSADASALLRHADLAMYRAKELGKNGWQVFSDKLRNTVAARLELEQALRDAIVRDELFLLYQPKLDLADGHLVGLEALVRWRHPVRGVVSPAEFIPVAEKSDLIVELGAWVLEHACAQMARWRKAGLALPVSINVSTRHFAHGTLVAAVEDALMRHQLPAEWLELEITEGAMMTDIDQAQQQLLELDALGVSVSIDDFGTGYSSLALLPRLRVDALKIDRSFLVSMQGDNGEGIYRAVLAMAAGLGLRTVAEGVETEAQAAFLRDAGCSQAQGFLFARPLAAEDAAKLAVMAWRHGQWRAVSKPDAVELLAVGVEGTD